MNVNSDHDKAVVVETLMMGLLVSGLVWLKVKQRRTKEFSKQPYYHQGVCLFLCVHLYLAYSVFKASIIHIFMYLCTVKIRENNVTM